MPDDPTPPGEPLARRTTTVYDALGRPTRWYDAPGSVTFTTYTYDPADDSPEDGPDEDPPDEPHVVG